MKLLNHSKEKLQRKNEHGTWVMVAPGQLTYDMPATEAEYLLRTEPHFWAQDIPAPVDKPKKRGGA